MKATRPGAKRLRHERIRRVALGVTLVASALALTVLGIILLPRIFGDPQAETTRTQMHRLADAIQHHAWQTGSLPSTLDAIAWAGPAARVSFEDGYGRIVQYKRFNSGGGPVFELRSSGEDGVYGNADDLLWP